MGYRSALTRAPGWAVLYGLGDELEHDPYENPQLISWGSLLRYGAEGGI
ncbi:MAG: hypothetical protein GX058_06715 [Firmicutes bacterium]|nr:hypothetical protein [Bacillota bacterium]